MKLILSKYYFRAQMIYTCFQRRLGNKKLCAKLENVQQTFSNLATRLALDQPKIVNLHSTKDEF